MATRFRVSFAGARVLWGAGSPPNSAYLRLNFDNYKTCDTRKSGELE